MTVAQLVARLQEIAIAHDASEVPVRVNQAEWGPTDIAEVRLETIEPVDLPFNAPPQRLVHVVLD